MTVIAVVVLLWPAPAGAETTIEVTTPAEGRFRPGGPTPLLVTIEADRAISGTLTASFDGFPAGSQRVEVPGGSAKDIVFIVTVPPWSGSGSVGFDGDDDADDQTVRVNLIPAGGDELVAVLPELAARDLPPSADVTAEIGVARLFPLDVELLDSGNEILAPFSQVIATGGDLAALAGPRLEALETWVGSDGGILIVDEEPGWALPFDPRHGVTVDDDTIGFGLGTIHFSGGRAAAGDYDGLVQATPATGGEEFPWGGEFFGGGFPTTNILASDAGVRIPAIGSIVLVLIGYAVVAGPILWLVLKRSRREPLLWLALPAVALVTTGGVYAAGQALRDDASTAHATLYADLPTQRLVSSQVLVTSPNGGSAGVRLPDGWRPARVVSDQFFFEGPFGPNGGAAVTDPVLAGSDLAIDLPPGGVGVIGAEAAEAALAPSWSFELRPEDADLVGTITNLTDHDLEEVFVTSGQGFSTLDRVESGQSVDVTLRNVSQPPINGDPLMERLWRFDGFSGDVDGVLNPGLLMDWISTRPELRSPGYIMIVGWTRDEVGPLTTTGGAPVTDGRTAFLTADRLDAGLIDPELGLTEFLRGWGSTRVSDPIGANECTDFPVTVRITPGQGVVGSDPVVVLSRQAIAAFDLWNGTSWLPAGMAEVARDEQVVVAVPGGAFADGSLYLRLQMTCDFWGAREPFPAVRSAGPDDEVLAIGGLGSGASDDGGASDTPVTTTTTGPAATVDAGPTTTTGAG